MFNFLKKMKDGKLIELGAPVKGQAVELSKVEDPTFSEGILGKGAAVVPVEGILVAPADGVVSMMFNTLHAVTLTSDSGVEILIHIGFDTVELKGKFFKEFAKTGDKVKKGDKLIEFDINGIKEAGYNITTVMVICNTDEFASVEAEKDKEVERLDNLITITKK